MIDLFDALISSQLLLCRFASDYTPDPTFEKILDATFEKQTGSGSNRKTWIRIQPKHPDPQPRSSNLHGHMIDKTEPAAGVLEKDVDPLLDGLPLLGQVAVVPHVLGLVSEL